MIYETTNTRYPWKMEITKLVDARNKIKENVEESY